ncbi:hypothetical protein, partial [Endozoicomonas sp.]|uniref:hypothetical protein n=1 Tax=Endozoicomonas sp. TaxID=1892382 RepID=UPI00383A5B3A
MASLTSRSLPLLSKGIEKSDRVTQGFYLELTESLKAVVSLGILNLLTPNLLSLFLHVGCLLYTSKKKNMPEDTQVDNPLKAT